MMIYPETASAANMKGSEHRIFGHLMAWIKKNLITIILFGIIFVGAALIAYPSFSDWWNSFHQSRAIISYSEAISNMKAEEHDAIIAAAESYNRENADHGITWKMTEEEKARYEKELSVDDTGIMGYIDIPKINISLPVYHGVEENVLQKAVGHISETSLPVGGGGTHCVLSGHRGLPSARLFTDIDKLVEGDTWTITVLNRTLTYEVDQIRIVEPTDMSFFQKEPDADYCTLVTCTPYGINTHRLLVRGHRVANAQGEANIIADAIMIDSNYTTPFFAAPIVLAALIWLMISTGKKARKKARRTAGRRDGADEKKET